jgi:hypothetical protein
MTKRKTITLQGKNYVQVAERIRAIHAERKDAFTIGTTYELTAAGNIVFTATLTIKTKDGELSFTGHSFGKLGGAKAFEKLETVAVGRALAFAGYHGDGDIASADEMESFEQEVDYEKIEVAQLAIADATTIEELQKVYQKLEKGVKGNKAVIAAKDARKKELANV